MTKKEIDECKFIRDNLKFYTYDDFLENKWLIKSLYEDLDNKIFYKWFVYANIHITLEQKDTIWEFLNDNMMGVEYERDGNRNFE